ESLLPVTPHGAQALDQIVTRQAQIIAYSNDFKLMMITSLPILLLLPLMRRPQPQQGGKAEHAAVME
ncbi:MAG: EmrB/QacA family drug resistance transporter, partial [Rhodospirillales bacterium]|nr:EmrB/QacA family drug resistance transporter [Rhodospirillales bacterium]